MSRPNYPGNMISLQDEAIERLGQTRSSQRRWEKYRGVVCRWFTDYAVEHFGHTEQSARRIFWDQVVPMYELQQAAEDES